MFHREDFCSGETRFAEDRRAEFEHLLGGGRAAVAAEGLDAVEDGGGGFAGNGLVGDGFEEGFVGGLRGVHLGLEWSGFGYQGGEYFVFRREVARGCG